MYRLISLIFVPLLTAGWIGCSGVTENVETSQSVPKGPDQQSLGSNLDSSLAIWQAGQKDEAARQLSEISEQDLAAASSSPVLRLSEEDCKRLSVEERTRLQEQVLEAVPLLRGLGNHCLAAGRKSISDGDVES